MKTVCFLLMSLMLAAGACAPNQSIALDNRATETANANNTPASTPEPSKKITVGELMDRVANAPPDSFLFPCTLNTYSTDDRARLRKLRQQWLSKEEDSRYLISPSTGCACPGICVLVVEDAKTVPPKNFAILIIDDLSKYSFLNKNLEFINAKLTWASTIPIVQFMNSNGNVDRSCSIELDKKRNLYTTACSDGNGKELPPLGSE
jgi:hypothetical protein